MLNAVPIASALPFCAHRPRRGCVREIYDVRRAQRQPGIADARRRHAAEVSP